MVKRVIPYDQHLAKVSGAKNIDDLVGVFKNFIHNQFDILPGDTFKEIQDIVDKKHIAPHLREHIRSAAKRCEELEYRPQKPTSSELSHLKTRVHSLIRSSKEAFAPELQVKQGLFARMRKAREEKVEKIKGENYETDSEYREMLRFLEVSKTLGIPPKQVQHELLIMGFPDQKVNQLLKN